jgi:uncharacterized protein YecE (DUF72 family)
MPVRDRVARVRVGLCGFSMAMRAYARDFPVVEVQGTFYDPPTDASMHKWREATGPDLEYTIKVWQLVTHPSSSPTYRRMTRHALRDDDDPGFFRDSPGVRRGWLRSVECADSLGATAMLFQCPASFAPDPANVARMRRFFERVERPAARLLWEPRGRAWIAARETALALCRDLDLVHVVDPFVTAPDPGHEVYWRLHGPGGSARASYDDDALQRLRGMLSHAGTAGPAYVMFNNLPRVGDARRFSRLMERAG